MNVLSAKIPDDYRIPKTSPLAQLAAYHASRGQTSATKDIIAYSYFQDKMAQGDESFNQDAFKEIRDRVHKDYQTPTNFEGLAEKNDDFKARLEDLKGYVDDFNKNPEKSIKEMIPVALKTTQRKKDNIQDLIARLSEGTEKFWEPLSVEKDSAQKTHYIEPEFVRMAQGSLSKYNQLLSAVTAQGKEIAKDKNPKWVEEYSQAMKDIGAFLQHPDERDDVGFAELPYSIGKHRSSSGFSGTTQEKYAEIDILVERLVPKMPSFEKYREDVDLTHNLVDPNYQEKAYGLKLSAINAKHNVGLSRDDIDMFGVTTAALGTIMRGYGIEEIDDRYKQYIHNTGDHSLRTVVTAASLRDSTVRRFVHLHENGMIDDEQLEAQKELAQETATFMAKKATLHDLGEFLNEVLGNNLKGRTQEEEKLLRKLRDQLEGKIIQDYGLPEIEHRLEKGAFAERWDAEKFAPYQRMSEDILGLKGNKDVAPQENYDAFESKFHDTSFEIIERLNSQQDIISFRQVGKINEEGEWQNASNMGRADDRYTAQYALSKMVGHKFETIDDRDIADYNNEEYERRIKQKEHQTSSTTAESLGVPKQYSPDIDRQQDMPSTRVGLDDYLLKKDVNYAKSHFKQLADEIKEDHKALPKDEAVKQQIHKEASLYALAFEVVHYTKKHARISDNLDDRKMEKAVVSSIAQGVDAMQADLKKEGLDLAYLQQANIRMGTKRYHLTEVSDSKALGGALGNPEKPDQLIGLNAPIKAVNDILKGVKNLAVELVYKPVNTVFQAPLLKQNEKMKESDYQHMLGMLTSAEIGGDVSLSAVGLAQKEGASGQDAMGDGTLDPKSFSLLSPLVTATLKSPRDFAEAIDKSYPHILHKYANQIADEYGVDREAIRMLKKPKHIETGDYEKKVTDVSESGRLAELMYRYHDEKYGGGDKDHDKIDEDIVKKIDKAEAFALRNLLQTEINKAIGRTDMDVDPAENVRRTEKMKLLRDTKKNIKSDAWFDTRAEHNMGIRFGMVAVFGGLYATSQSGVEIPLPFTDATINSSATFLNLMAAGTAAFAADVATKISTKLPESHPVKRWAEGLAHFVMGDDGSVEVIKGDSVRKGDMDGKTPEEISHHLQKKPSAGQQLLDAAVAMVVTPVRAVANRNTSSKLFGNQHSMTSIDAGGVIAGNAGKWGTDPLSAGIQTVGAATGLMLFSRSTVQTMWLNKMSDTLSKGKDISYETIKKQVAEEDIKSNMSEPVLNGLTFLAKNTGLIGKAIDKGMDQAVEGSAQASRAIYSAQTHVMRAAKRIDRAISHTVKEIVTAAMPREKEIKGGFTSKEVERLKQKNERNNDRLKGL